MKVLNPKLRLIIILSAMNLLICLITQAFFAYGIFRDELYYIACANRLQPGYVDHPPLSIYILAVWKFLFSDSLLSIRIIPSIVSSITIFMIGLFTERLGGGKAAIIIAALAYMFSPIFLGMNTIFSMNTFDFFFWITSSYLFLKIIQTEDKALRNKNWIWLGVIIGLGLLNKTSMFWLGTGIFLGTIFSPLRTDLKTKYPYLAAGIALLIFFPNIIWNITHDFAHLEFMRNAASMKYGGLTPVSFILDQMLILNPLSFFIWLPGFYFFFFTERGKKYKAVVFIYITTFLILLINGHSKGEYVAAAYQILFAGGAVMIEFWSKKRNWLKYAIAIPVVSFGILLAPFARPLLQPEAFIKYQSAIGLEPPSNEGHELVGLPQFYSDMFGWEDLARKVSEVYQSLPEEERSKTLVYCSNYGKAGAIEFYSKKYPLPKVICPHNSYWYWWPDDVKYTTIIIIGGSIEDHLSSLKEVYEVGFYSTKYSMPYENNLSIFIGRELVRSLEEIKQSNKIFI
ncbi:MAG: glycosyltransferase family 39 protein [Ignavibacteriaceae bacterium]